MLHSVSCSGMLARFPKSVRAYYVKLGNSASDGMGVCKPGPARCNGERGWPLLDIYLSPTWVCPPNFIAVGQTIRTFIQGAPKKYPLKIFCYFFSRTIEIWYEILQLLTQPIIRKLGSFIILSTELTKLRCFYSSQLSSWDFIKNCINYSSRRKRRNCEPCLSRDKCLKYFHHRSRTLVKLLVKLGTALLIGPAKKLIVP